MKTKKTLRAVICNIIAWIFSAICLIPLLLILVNSLKDKKSAAAMNLKPPSLPIPWENFIKVIENFLKLLYKCFSFFIIYLVIEFRKITTNAT